MNDLRTIVSVADESEEIFINTDNDDSERSGPTSTRSKSTTVFGFLAIATFVPLVFFGLLVAEPHSEQQESVKLMFIHLPSVLVTYVSFFCTLVCSILYLTKKSKFWDLLAGASAEIGVLFCGILLLSGSLWGKPTWGVYWQWDPRLTSTAVMFVMYLGYLAVRRMDIAAEAKSRRAAVLGIVSFLNVLIVHYSIDWWRGLHQGRTFESSEIKIEGWYLFSLMFGMLFFSFVAIWMVIHKFRILWLEYQLERMDLELAINERRSEVNDLDSSIDADEEELLFGGGS